MWNGVFGGASLREALRQASQSDELCAKLDAVVEDLSQSVYTAVGDQDRTLSGA